MLREMPSFVPAPKEEIAPESGKVPMDFTVEREGDTLRFWIHNEDVRDVFSHAILDRFPLERVHQRRAQGVLQVTVDQAGSLTDEEIDQIKEEIAMAGTMSRRRPAQAVEKRRA
jgi:hypothetical protein